MRQSNIVPSGRMLTLTRVRAKDVPDMDRGGSDANISDPYLIFDLRDAHGETVDATRTPHVDNARHPKWLDQTWRLFIPDNDAPRSGHTGPVGLHITLMDFNKKKAHGLIGEVTVSLEVSSQGLLACHIIAACTH